MSMKILQLNNFYNEGSTGKIVHDIKAELDSRKIDNIACYGRGNDIKQYGVVRVCSNFYSKVCKLFSCITGLKYGWCHLSTKRIIRIIETEKPDIVHLHCINDNIVNIYRIIRFLNENKIETIITLHAEFLYTANCGYALDCDNWKSGCGQCPRLRQETQSFFLDRTHDSWIKLNDSYNNFGDRLHLVSVSPWLYNRVKSGSMLQSYKNTVILNGINTDIFYFRKGNLRKKYGIEHGAKVVLHVTASFSRPIKGGKYVVDLAIRNPDYVFIIIGNDDKEMQFPKNVIDVGRLFDQNVLADYYSLSNILLITSKKETFCMPVAESLCCGTPVVGFFAGAPEEITIGEYSSFVEFGNLDLLEIELKKWINLNIEKERISEEAIKKYSRECMAQEYIELYYSIIENSRNIE